MNPSPLSARFTSAHVRAGIVKVLLVVGAAATGIGMLVELSSFAFPPLTEDQALADNPVGAVIALLMFFLGLLDLIIYVTTVVFFCMWLYRAYGNLRAFTVWPRLDYSPGWAVASFFVPFVNLIVPYRAVREVWQKSGLPDEARLSEPKPPAWFPVWWTFWLLASFAGNAAFRASFNENIPERTVTIISTVAGGLAIVAAVFAYLVVDEIDQRQEETSGKLGLGKFAMPPPPPANLGMSDLATPAFSPNSSQQS